MVVATESEAGDPETPRFVGPAPASEPAAS